MRIGLIVDGEAEFFSLPALMQRVDTPHEVRGRVVHAHIHPLGGIPKLVHRLIVPVKALVEQRRADKVVVLLDREQRRRCCGDIAHELKGALERECARQAIGVLIEVVLKDRTFENWLVADPEALRKSPKRFDVKSSFVKQVEPDRADAADGLKLLKAATRKGGYDKVADGRLILSVADPLRIGANSRSFRRFLRVIGAPQYEARSRRPAPPGNAPT